MDAKYRYEKIKNKKPIIITIMTFRKLSDHVYLVGGPSLSHSYDCNVYLIDGRPFECVLIDSGCGLGTEEVLKNIR